MTWTQVQQSPSAPLLYALWPRLSLIHSEAQAHFKREKKEIERKNKRIGKGEVNMYIPEFWAGVLSVVSAEMIAFIAVIIYAIIKSGKKGKEEDD